MPEIASDAALLIDPLQSESISDAMIALASSSKLRLELIEKGHERAAHFTWSRSASLLWESIEKAVQ